MRAASAVAVLFLTSVLAGLADPAAATLSEGALSEGNRLFEGDEIEAALEAYARGWQGDGSPTDGVLAYNAGTSALRLGRLPEALLWFRRAEAVSPGDPWLRDNLALTRDALGEPPVAVPAWGKWLASRLSFAVLGVALSWAGFLLILLVRHPPRGLLGLLALLACAAFLAGIAGVRLPGQDGVLLTACGRLPAGSEVWVRPIDGGGWRIVGQRDGLRCPAEAVGLVRPPRR
jgi:tetratricopeptide (TPR) repeat protein